MIFFLKKNNINFFLKLCYIFCNGIRPKESGAVNQFPYWSAELEGLIVPYFEPKHHQSGEVDYCLIIEGLWAAVAFCMF